MNLWETIVLKNDLKREKNTKNNTMILTYNMIVKIVFCDDSNQREKRDNIPNHRSETMRRNAQYVVLRISSCH